MTSPAAVTSDAINMENEYLPGLVSFIHTLFPRYSITNSYILGHNMSVLVMKYELEIRTYQQQILDLAQ